MAPDLLKLTALDVEDLRIISAHLQDAVMRVGDIRYLPVENRFAVVLNRFDPADDLHRRNRQWLETRKGLEIAVDLEALSSRLASPGARPRAGAAAPCVSC